MNQEHKQCFQNSNQEFLEEAGISEETCLTGAETMCEEGLKAAGIMQKMQCPQRKKGKNTLASLLQLCTVVPPTTELTEATGKGT